MVADEPAIGCRWQPSQRKGLELFPFHRRGHAAHRSTSASTLERQHRLLGDICFGGVAAKGTPLLSRLSWAPGRGSGWSLATADPLPDRRCPLVETAPVGWGCCLPPLPESIPGWVGKCYQQQAAAFLGQISLGPGAREALLHPALPPAQPRLSKGLLGKRIPCAARGRCRATGLGFFFPSGLPPPMSCRAEPPPSQ